MITNVTPRTVFLAVLMASFVVAPAQGNISLQLFEGEYGDASNPFRNAICSILTCTDNGGPLVVNQLEDFVGNILDGGTLININVDGGGRQRKLRVADTQRNRLV